MNNIVKSNYINLKDKHLNILNINNYYIISINSSNSIKEITLNNKSVNKILNYISNIKENSIHYITIAIIDDTNSTLSNYEESIPGLNYYSVNKIMKFHGKLNFISKIQYSIIFEKVAKYDLNHNRIDSVISFKKNTSDFNNNINNNHNKVSLLEINSIRFINNESKSSIIDNKTIRSSYGSCNLLCKNRNFNKRKILKNINNNNSQNVLTIYDTIKKTNKSISVVNTKQIKNRNISCNQIKIRKSFKENNDKSDNISNNITSNNCSFNFTNLNKKASDKYRKKTYNSSNYFKENDLINIEFSCSLDNKIDKNIRVSELVLPEVVSNINEYNYSEKQVKKLTTKNINDYNAQSNQNELLKIKGNLY